MTQCPAKLSSIAFCVFAVAGAARAQDGPPSPNMAWASVVRQRVVAIAAAEKRRSGRSSMQANFRLDREGNVLEAAIADSSVRPAIEGRFIRRLRATHFPPAPDAEPHQLTVRINFR